MQLLEGVDLAGRLILLPGGTDHDTAHGELQSLLRDAAGAEAAGLFAQSRKSGNRLEFLAPPGRLARFDSLGTEGRNRLQAEIGRLAGILLHSADKAALRNPDRFGHLPLLVAAAIEIPSFEHVYAHEGRPVLAAWGLSPTGAPDGLGLIRRLDKGQPPPAPERFPFLAASLAAASLLALGAIAALATPLLSGLLGAPEPVCRIATADQQVIDELAQERRRELDLRLQLASFQKDLGDRRSHCALRNLPLPPTTTPSPTPPPPASPPTAAAPKADPPKPPPPAAARPPERPPDTQPCNVETQSGGAGITATRHFLGAKAGRVRLNFDTFKEPDRIIVYYKGKPVAQTNGYRSGVGFIEFDWNPPPGESPSSYVVVAEVTGTPGSRSTLWRYNLGCPVSR